MELMSPQEKEELKARRAREAREAEQISNDPGTENLCDGCA